MVLPQTTELAALERLQKSSYKVVNTLAPSFLIKSSFLLVRRITIKSSLSLKFSLIGLCTAEFAAFDRLEKNPHRLLMVEMF